MSAYSMQKMWTFLAYWGGVFVPPDPPLCTGLPNGPFERVLFFSPFGKKHCRQCFLLNGPLSPIHTVRTG